LKTEMKKYIFLLIGFVASLTVSAQVADFKSIYGLTSDTLTLSSATGTYTKIGRHVPLNMNISITDNGTGDYTVNFTTAMPDVNYATMLTVAGNRVATDQMLSNVATNGNANANNPELYSTTQVRIRSGNTSATFANLDVTYYGIVIFR